MVNKDEYKNVLPQNPFYENQEEPANLEMTVKRCVPVSVCVCYFVWLAVNIIIHLYSP